MIDIVYANAYKEVIEVLKHVSKEDYDKIPQDKINLFKKCANENYNFTYDINKTLDEQNVSKKAKTIIAILYRDYWATDEQRKKIKAKEVTVTEAVTAALDAIEAKEKKVNSFVTVDREGALKRAEEVQKMMDEF